ncbi:MAG: DUF1330 domain-containing protein [Rhodothermales bacterium]
MAERYVEVTQEAGAALFARGIEGEIVMLNLLRFRDKADYSAAPELAPAEGEISGREAYRRYIEHTLPYLRKSGGEVIFMGEGGRFVIGPADESWDQVLLVRHKSLKQFMAFASDEGYLSGAGHRTAALADSRLLPIEEADQS